MRDFFDLHAAGGAGHDHGSFDGAVHQDAEIEFALDVEAFLDQQAAHDAATGTGLRRDQVHAQNLRGQLRRFVGGTRQLHAAAFAAAAGMDLRLDHHDRRAELLGDLARLFGAGHHLAARRGNAEAAENFLSLIFVNFHRRYEFGATLSIL